MQTKEQIEAKRICFLETGYKLFSEKGIDAVTLKDVAEATEYGTATMYRHFDKKPGFVVAVAAWKWEQFAAEIWAQRNRIEKRHKMTSAEEFEYYLDSFLMLYREHPDMLRFNQFFNIYLRAEQLDPEAMKPYREFISLSKEEFHSIYEKGMKDHMIRTDEPEEKMFSKTLHLMLAAVTRYAVGLVYIPENGFDAMEELEFLKNVILKEYRM